MVDFKNIIIQLYTDINRKLSADWNSLLTGFYSKDVLELAGARYSLSVHFSYLLASFSVLTTSYYSWRLIWFCFHTNQNKFQLGRLSNTQKQTIQHAHDADWVMALPLIILALGSIYGGFCLSLCLLV
jgi:NADH-ubiquinone oxidoreductase chain 5